MIPTQNLQSKAGRLEPRWEAANWYQRATEKGLAVAQYNLGLCHEKGEGVSADPVAAWQWLQLAAIQKFPNVPEARDNVQAALTGDQLTEARARSEHFKAGGKP